MQHRVKPSGFFFLTRQVFFPVTSLGIVLKEIKKNVQLFTFWTQFSFTIKTLFPQTCSRRAYLSKVRSGCFEAAHLQSLLEEVKWVCEGFADHSSSTPTDQASQESLPLEVNVIKFRL